MADITNTTSDTTLYDENGNPVAIILHGSVYRLGVDAKITSIEPGALLARVDDPVHQEDMDSNSVNHINYTVPTGKVLYIQSLTTAYADSSAGTLYVEWQEDGSGFHGQTIGDNIASNHALFTDGNPIGAFPAGTVIRARKVRGSSNREWSASFTGYLEDS